MLAGWAPVPKAWLSSAGAVISFEADVGASTQFVVGLKGADAGAMEETCCRKLVKEPLTSNRTPS